MPPCCRQSFIQDVVYVTIGNTAFCLALYLTGVHLRASYSTLVTLVSKNSSVDQSDMRCPIGKGTLWRLSIVDISELKK